MVVMPALDHALFHVVVITVMPADAHMIMITVAFDLDVLVPVMVPGRAVLVVLGGGGNWRQAHTREAQGSKNAVHDWAPKGH
ncbi:hypothetical protein ASF56_23080 [Methylobacterium sp. Leaf122]|nr:hypothetical protein [Methylobacterium sp. Leaf122]KQQ17607.1 hypothetical protein ASF56_23080 [Methylobacterium sp. Leaf122]